MFEILFKIVIPTKVPILTLMHLFSLELLHLQFPTINKYYNAQFQNQC